MDAITVQALTKRYGQLAALGGVDLAVPSGVLFGLLGPNGAGKSTLIKAVVGALRPTSGTVRVLGCDPLADRAALRRQIGYMPQSPALYADLTARANIRFFARAHELPDLERRVDEALALTELAARAGDKLHTFSGGMQRRISLACAMVHGPRLLLLDEPTAAVDPALRARFWQSFRDLAAGGATLFISTHLMDEALLCDRVAVLSRGRLIACDTPHALLERGSTRVRISRNGQVSQVTTGGHPEDLARALRPFGLAPDVGAVSVEADTLETVMLRLIEADEDR